ncbi:hypothetical protein [Corynebacterium frankenforstense]
MKNFRRRTGLTLATAAVTACSLLSPVAANAQSSVKETTASTTAAASTPTPAPADNSSSSTEDKKTGEPTPSATETNTNSSTNGSSSSPTLFEEFPEFKEFCASDKKAEDYPDDFTIEVKGNKLSYDAAKAKCSYGEKPSWWYPTQEFDKGLMIFNTVLAVLAAVAGVVGFIFKINPNLVNDIKGTLRF